MRISVAHIGFWVIFSVATLTSTCQQLNISQNTHFNLFNENRAFAGNYDATHFTAEYFKMWNINGAPESFSFSAHTPISAERMGMGISANRTGIGAHEEISFKGTFAYKLPLRTGRLGFGLTAGFTQYNFNSNSLEALDPDDELIFFSGLSGSVLDFDFSAVYTNNLNYLGLEINQLSQSAWNLNETDNSSQKLHFKLVGGHVFKLANKDFIRSSLHVRSANAIRPQADLMAAYFYKKKLWLGAGFRTGYGALFSLEVNFTRRLQAGYFGAMPLNSEVTWLTPSHSVFIGYMLPSEASKAPSIRNF
ncbi:MAG: PorP/SprF family type IX secretion system membrane protein [Flavobacteriales bacterium]